MCVFVVGGWVQEPGSKWDGRSVGGGGEERWGIRRNKKNLQ